MTVRELISNHKRFFLIESILIITAVFAFASIYLQEGPEKVVIAVVVPDLAEEKQWSRSIALLKEDLVAWGRYIEQSGLEFEIQEHEDKGDPTKAQSIAEEIVADNEVAAVIGHYTKETTQAAIDIYEKAGVPLIVPVSNVVTESPWVFQVSPAPEGYGVYMAHYIKQALKKQTLLIVQTEQNDTALLESFIKTYKKIGGKVEKQFILKSGADNSEQEIDRVVAGIEAKENNMLLLATEAKHTVPLIVALKRKGVSIPIMANDPGLSGKFGQFQEDKACPGYFLDGIYAPSMVSFENDSPDIGYHDNKKIDYSTLTMTNSVYFLARALLKRDKSLRAFRKALKSGLEQNVSFNEKKQGKATGLFMGVFNYDSFVYAPIQPTVVTTGQITKEADKSKLLTINEENLYPTDYVYTGVSMNKVRNLDKDNNIYTLDFFLWFRYRNGVVDVDDIKFLNAVEPARLFDILQKDNTTNFLLSRRGSKISIAADMENSATADDALTARLVESTSSEGMEHRLYHVKGRFKTSYHDVKALGQRTLFVRFRNCKLIVKKLRYIPDYIHRNNGIYDLRNFRFDLRKQANFKLIENERLKIDDIEMYSVESKNMILGQPGITDASGMHGAFRANYYVVPALLSFRGAIFGINEKISRTENRVDLVLMTLLLSFSLAICIFARYGLKHGFLKYQHFWWCIQITLITFILLLSELAGSQALFSIQQASWFREIFNGYQLDTPMYYWEKIIAVLWWVIPAYYITSAFDQFLWQPIKRRTGNEIPHVLRLVVSFITYSLALFAILAFVFEITVTGLAATSGVIAIILAFASKIDLSNVIAGLGITFSKLFSLGDWVRIDGTEGKVVEMTARSTKILTFDSSIINIPNTSVSSAVIENYSHPNEVFRLLIRLETVPVYRFERVEKVLLDAVASTEGVLDTPAPVVFFKGQGDSCQIYEVAFFINDYARRALLWQAAWRRIWRHLEQANITLATPQREIFMAETADENVSSPVALLDNCGVFSEITEVSKTQLAEKIKYRTYHAGEVIVRRGEDNEHVFIVTEGVVAAITDNKENDKEKRLGVAEVFALNSPVINETIIAKTESRVMMIKQEDLTLAVQQDSCGSD